MMTLFDTHAHYDSRQFDCDRDAVLSVLPEQGVALVVNPGCDLLSSCKAVELAQRYPFVYAAVGVHPEDCVDWEDGCLLELRALAANRKVRAIGEIGLDYYWKENPPRALQQNVFRRQLELAQSLRLTGRPTGTAWTLSGLTQRLPGCSTAFPEAWRWPGSWWTGGG